MTKRVLVIGTPDHGRSTLAAAVAQALAAKQPKASWYCDQCAVEVYDRTCPHCGKTKRQAR